MRKVVIASHGYLARGMESTLSLFMQVDPSITFLCGYVDEEAGEPVEEAIRRFFSEVSEEDEVIVFTDLLGGSVNAAFLPYLSQPGIHLITGFNLGLILEVLAAEEAWLTDRQIEQMIRRARKGMVHMNTYQVSYNDQDDV